MASIVGAGVRASVSRVRADVAGLPLAVALLSVVGLRATPAVKIRWFESEADIFGLNAAREPEAFASVAMRLATMRKLEAGAARGDAVASDGGLCGNSAASATPSLGFQRQREECPMIDLYFWPTPNGLKLDCFWRRPRAAFVGRYRWTSARATGKSPSSSRFRRTTGFRPWSITSRRAAARRCRCF